MSLSHDFSSHELMMDVSTANLIQNISRTEQFRVLNSFPDIVNLENSFKYIYNCKAPYHHVAQFQRIFVARFKVK